ncbi:MAG: hypothetical protein AB7S38_27725 [Vulcanimicrobiota bacterium]
MKNSNRLNRLDGEIQSPAGLSPESAWKPVGDQMQRASDVWLAGDPFEMLSGGHLEWKRKIQERLQVPKDSSLGLRMRFVPANRETRLDLPTMVHEVLEAVESPEDGRLFVHAEVTDDTEAGLYLAHDNRPPALTTQVWLHSGHKEGRLKRLSGPIHLNLLFHDPGVRFAGLWRDGTMDWLLGIVHTMLNTQHNVIQELSLARSNARQGGISIGAELVHQLEGAGLKDRFA